MKHSKNLLNKATARSVLCGALGVLLSTLFLFLGTPVRGAATSCEFQGDFDTITAIQQDASLDSLARIQAELAVRKTILKKIITCLTQDVSNLKGKLAEIPITAKSNPDLVKVRDRLNLSLDQTIDFYDTQRTHIEDLGIRGSQDIARAIQDWKTSNYAAASEEVVSFIIWFKNQDLIRTAQDRLNQIEKSVNDAGLSDNPDIARLLHDSAEVNLANTILENNNALKNFVVGGDPARSLQSVKASLGSLTAMYQNFFDIGELVKKALPS